MNIGLGIGIPFTRSSLWASIFTPSALFLDGSTQGVWYDPSDINLTWRRNLLAYSEQFDAGVWSKVSSAVSVNQIAAPDGATTADFMVETATTAEHLILQSQALSWGAGSKVVGSVYAKSGGRRYIRLLLGGSTTGWNAYCVFDLIAASTGSPAANSAAIVSRSITDVGNGWYRCELVVTPTVSSSSGAVIQFNTMLSMDANASNYTGDGTSGIYIWGAQLEQGSTATPYQRITDGIQDYLTYQPLPVLYRDAAGTLPVTAVEQPVGLMLDKSKGLVLGSELVSDPGFDNLLSWTTSTGWAITGGKAVATAAASGSVTTAVISVVSGRWYKCTYTISDYFSGSFALKIGGALGVVRTANGTYTEYILTPATNGLVELQVRTVGGSTLAVDNVSVRELPGNHAFNSSGNSANFPVLSARYNLLTKTEQFDDAVWTKQGSPVITPDTTVAPDGSLTADTLAISPSNYVYQSINITAGVTYTLSCWVKVASGVNQFKLNTFGSGNNFTSDVKTATTNWQQFSFTFTSIASGATSLYAPIVDGLTGGNFYIWGADLRVANDALNQPTYQRVNTATDYDTVGFKPYVRFNGVSQWLQTNSIDFSYSDKMFVCAGVRKLLDASYPVLAEISTSWSANNGTFTVGGGDPNGYVFGSRGTVSSPDIVSGYVAPNTSVLSGIGNISGNQAILRVNGTQATISADDQGTGNYGNYPLYIGARAGTSLFFNGRLYQLVIAAGSEIRVAEEDSDLFLSESGDFITAETTVAVIQSAIEQTEAFVNRKTSAF